MQQINSFLYDQWVTVQVTTDPTITQRNRVVYTRPIQIYKGVDNILKIKVQNGDQKAVDITGYALQFNIVDAYVNADANVVLRANVTIVNSAAGLGTVTLSSNDVAVLDRESYTYAVVVNTGTANVAAYVDDNYGASGQLLISSIPR
jgi:homogentisate 1,2-dioxygenase